jgi:hypothetical protein
MGGLPRFRGGPANVFWEDNGELRPLVDVEYAATGLGPGTEAPEIVRGLDAGLKGVKLSGGAEEAELLRAIGVVV